MKRGKVYLTTLMKIHWMSVIAEIYEKVLSSIFAFQIAISTKFMIQQISEEKIGSSSKKNIQF